MIYARHPQEDEFYNENESFVKDGIISIQERTVDSSEIHFKAVENGKVPASFKKEVVNLIDTAEKVLGNKVGSGTADAFFGSLKIAIGNAKKRVEESKDIKNYYSVIIPGLVLKKAPNASKLSGDEISDKIITSAGFKKGVQLKNSIYTRYYYKPIQGNCIAFCAFAHGLDQIQIHVSVLEDNAENRKVLKESTLFESATISSEGFNHDEDEVTPNTDGFEGMSLKDYLGYDPDLGLTRSEELANDDTYGNFFKDPKVMAQFTEHFDLTDRDTRRAIIYMNEAEQSAALTSLTSKLYDNIVSKVDDIDYGEIPATKGDITKLSNYDKLRECIDLLRGILKEFKQDTSPIDVISEAMANVMSRKDLFGRAFRYNCEMPIIMYNNTVLSIIDGVSYMIATSIEFIKTPNQDSFQITLDKVAYAKSKSNMLYKNLERFNNCCKKGDFDKGMEHIIQNRIKGIGESAVAIALTATAATIGIVLSIIPILRSMVFFFYYTRMRVSDFFNIQADLLQMNAYNLQNNTDSKTNEDKERIVSKQLKTVELFRKIANKIAFTNKEAEVKATKEIDSESKKKMKLDDISDELPDGVSALF